MGVKSDVGRAVGYGPRRQWKQNMVDRFLDASRECGGYHKIESTNSPRLWDSAHTLDPKRVVSFGDLAAIYRELATHDT